MAHDEIPHTRTIGRLLRRVGQVLSPHVRRDSGKHEEGASQRHSDPHLYLVLRVEERRDGHDHRRARQPCQDDEERDPVLVSLLPHLTDRIDADWVYVKAEPVSAVEEVTPGRSTVYRAIRRADGHAHSSVTGDWSPNAQCPVVGQARPSTEG